MKKLLVTALAVLLVGAFTVPASAGEHEFGGYWNTRFFSATNFSGDNPESVDGRYEDTHTRLYYTAVQGDELKPVNKFEKDADWGGEECGDLDAEGMDAATIYYLGVNVDYSADMFSAWLTGIYAAGSVDVADDYQGNDHFGTDSFDIASYLFGVGGSVNLDAASVHGQVFYATGDDDGYTDNEASDFFVPTGQSYYWAEIMGYGSFDDHVSNGSPGDTISNIMAFNIGADIPMDKLTLSVDIWNASLIEDDVNGDTALGTEVDVAAAYQLLDDLKLKVVAAYLSVGDATGDENPMEMGAQLSLSF